VTDHRDRLSGREEIPYESDRIGIRTKKIRIRDASGQDQAVEIRRDRRRDRCIDIEVLRPVQMVESLDLAGLGLYQPGPAARFLHGRPRLGQLHLLDTLRRRQKRDRPAI